MKASMTTLCSSDPLAGIADPMGCVAVKDLPQGKDWQYEVMWKGQRVFGCKQVRHGSLYLPDGSAFDRGFSELQRDIARLDCRSAVVDGQIVPLGEDGRPAFLRRGSGVTQGAAAGKQTPSKRQANV